MQSMQNGRWVPVVPGLQADAREEAQVVMRSREGEAWMGSKSLDFMT
jgi:hypothetical protein